MKGNIFEEILGQESLFTDRKAFDHAFEPARLPHREHELDSLVRNLVDALNGHIPSNMLLYGVPGSGKTHTLINRYIDIVINKNQYVNLGNNKYTIENV